MDFEQLRGYFNTNFPQHETYFLTPLNFVSLAFKNISGAPHEITKRGSNVVNMIPGTQYVASRLREALDPKGLKCWSYNEVHECHRELGILHGYRSENCSVLQALLSLFRITNETTNFWTHFLPSLYFLWVFYSLSLTMPLFSDEYYYPFACYMMTSCAYPFMSCMAHAFSCLSLKATHVCFFMDYATLSIYSWGAAVLYYNYALPSWMVNTTYSSVFLPVAATMAFSTTFMTCASRFHYFVPTVRKVLRLGSFVLPYLWVSFPLMLRLVSCYILGESCGGSVLHHSRQFIGVLLASFFYGSHIPERFAPGRFDFVGHSHNLLHIFGAAATYEQLKGSLIDIEERRDFFRAHDWASNQLWLTVVSPLILCLNIVIIASFTRRLTKREDSVKND